MKKTEKLNVSLQYDDMAHRVGELVISKNNIYFKYDLDFLSTGINISPFKLPFNNVVNQSNKQLFEGLYGVFNDSLPDGWGRLLLDRYLQNKSINPYDISPLDRLAFVGKNGMGALIYEPETIVTSEAYSHLDLDFFNDEMQKILSGNSTDIVEDLFELSGSSGGARPKINVIYNPKTDDIIYGKNLLPEGYEHWIIKFSSSFDSLDAAQIEYAYHQMALEAGMDMMPCHLFKGKSGRYYFGTKRFDRLDNNRFHMHTASGLLHDDFRMSTLDYGHLLDATFKLEKNIKSYEKIFRLAAFNLYSHNRDDHSKNFSFLMNKIGQWQFAPVYDLTFSNASFGNHSTSFAGEYKNPTSQHLFELAKTFGVENTQLMLDEVKHAVAKWETIAKATDVSKDSLNLIKKVTGNLLKG